MARAWHLPHTTSLGFGDVSVFGFGDDTVTTKEMAELKTLMIGKLLNMTKQLCGPQTGFVYLDRSRFSSCIICFGEIGIPYTVSAGSHSDFILRDEGSS